MNLPIDPKCRDRDGHQHRKEQQHVAHGRLGKHRPQRRRGGDCLPANHRPPAETLPPSTWPTANRGWSPRPSISALKRATCSTTGNLERADFVRPVVRRCPPRTGRSGGPGFFATPGIDFNRETGRGTPFFYFTQGAAVAEVEIDRFTGEMRVPADRLADRHWQARSIPGIDRGQIIGGFIQGMGWVTNECLVYNEQGELLVAFADHLQDSRPLPTCRGVSPSTMFPNDDNTQNVAAVRPSANRR